MNNQDEQKIINMLDLAGIQYFGASSTHCCLEAIARIFHCGDIVQKAILVTAPNNYHGFILIINQGRQVAIKSGFASGYFGTGSWGLATAIQIFKKHQVDIEEYEVEDDFIERLDRSCLLESDLDFLEKSHPVRPPRYYDYLMDYSFPKLDEREYYNSETVRQTFPISMPFTLIDKRLDDLAINFFDNPDFAIMSAFRRLEGIIQNRANISEEVGAKLFRKAFQDEDAPLIWEDKTKPEINSMINLFVSVYGAFRNPRMHKEQEENEINYLREFLLINELFLLEGSAIKRDKKFAAKKSA